MKVCTFCHIEKGLDEFHLCKKGKMNRKSKCKECVKSETKEYYQKNIDYYKNYRENNKDSIRKRQKTWNTSNDKNVGVAHEYKSGKGRKGIRRAFCNGFF